MSVKFQPKGDKVLVRRAPQVTRTAGGLHVPDVAHDKALRGTCVAVGPYVEGVAAGAEVTFGKYAGIEMSPLGEEFVDCLLLSEAEVYGVLGVGVELNTAAELAEPTQVDAEFVEA